MAIFMVPKEFYGLGGIGEAASKIGATGRDYVETKRRRSREDFVFDEAQKDALREEENEIIKLSGQGSKDHLKWRAEKGLPTEGILVPIEVRQEQRRQELSTKPPEALTPVEVAELDALEGRPPGGYAEVVRSLRHRADFEDLQLKASQLALNTARLGEERAARAREVLKSKYGVDDGELDAMMQYAAYENNLLSQEATRANINESRARTGLYQAQASAETVGASGYSPVEMRNIADSYRDAGVTLNGKPVTQKDVQAYLTGTMNSKDRLQMDRGQMKLQLAPLAREAQDKVDDIRTRRARVVASRTVTLRQKDSDSKQAALDDYDAQLAALDAEERLVRNDFTAQREAISGAPSGTVANQIREERDRRNGTNTADVSAIPPELVESARSFTSLAAIEALKNGPGVTAEDLADIELMKKAFLIANPNADINLPAKPQPVRSTPARPSESARPARQISSRGARIGTPEITRARDRVETLKDEIAKLERNVNSPSMRASNLSKDDKDNLAKWNDELVSKKALLKRAEADLERLRG